jgi:hypothetical protein
MGRREDLAEVVSLAAAAAEVGLVEGKVGFEDVARAVAAVDTAERTVVVAEEGDGIAMDLQLAEVDTAEAAAAATVLVECTLSLVAPNNHSLAKQEKQGSYRIVVADMEAAEQPLGQVWEATEVQEACHFDTVVVGQVVDENAAVKSGHSHLEIVRMMHTSDLVVSDVVGVAVVVHLC